MNTEVSSKCNPVIIWGCENAGKSSSGLGRIATGNEVPVTYILRCGPPFLVIGITLERFHCHGKQSLVNERGLDRNGEGTQHPDPRQVDLHTYRRIDLRTKKCFIHDNKVKLLTGARGRKKNPHWYRWVKLPPCSRFFNMKIETAFGRNR